MSRVLIFTGGRLTDWSVSHIRSDDYLIGADRGAAFLINLGFRPNMAIGDFDSVTSEQRAHIRSHSDTFEECDPILKDYTDTELAFQLALDRSPDEIILFGALGTRVDHSLANIHLLLRAAEQGIRCRIIDECNELQATTGELQITNQDGAYTYVSLLPLTIEVTGIHLEGFRYPLYNATLTIGQSLGISNELIGTSGTIRIRSGALLVIQSKDNDTVE